MPPSSRIVYPSRPRPQKPFPPKAVFIAAGFLFIAILIAGLWYIVNLPYFRVDQIEITGTRLLIPFEIESAARKNISGVWWRVIPRDNFFFVSSRRMADGLRQKFLQVSEISVDKKFPDKLIVTVRERTLWGVYCERPAPSPRSPCFYLDAHGAAYEALAEFEGWLLPVIYSPEPASLGKEAALPAMLKFYSEAETALRAVSGHILFLNISTTTPDDVRLGLAENWELWVTASRPIAEWLEVLKTVLEKDIGERRPELEYMDLRFGNKVFYKFK